MSARGWLLALLAIAALVLAVSSYHRIERQVAVAEACESARDGRWQETLARSESLAGSDLDGRYAVECRCWALLATERSAECVALLSEILESPGARDWVPDPALATLLVRAWRDQGRMAGAADLARRAAAEHRGHLPLLELELTTRSAVEGEEAVLAEFDARRARSPAVGIALAQAFERRGDHERGLAVLGEVPPDPGGPLLTPWLEQRTAALAALGRLADVKRVFEQWRRLGGDPVELQARYAIRLSVSHLVDPEHGWIDLLRAALSQSDRLRDPALLRILYERLIAHLLVQREFEAALATFDEASERVELRAISREQLARSLAESRAVGSDPATKSAVRFRLPDIAAPSGTLLVSPDIAAPPDAPFEAHPLAPGREVTILRARSVWPQRWVYRDERDRVRASGAVWPSAAGPAVVRVELREAKPSSSLALAKRRPADGRPRVFSLILDCGDWRLVQYLRARRELPVVDHLLRTGHRAVLTSTPPLTAAAMHSLVWPGRAGSASFVAWAHGMGLELGGLASVGRNPLAFLALLMPEAENLFDVVGAREKVAANMLFSHGLIDGGRHAETVGPDGRRGALPPVRAFRPLLASELERFPGLARDERARSQIESMAAQLDSAIALAQAGDVDLLALRVESLDILTHAFFSELLRSGQDDGDRILLAVYRYIDWRLAALSAALDADDVLIVMSDHGIRTAMEHQPDAIFVAVGPGVPAGRAEGAPDLRGVPRVIADLLEIETRWPETGIARWLAAADEALAATSPAGSE